MRFVHAALLHTGGFFWHLVWDFYGKNNLCLSSLHSHSARAVPIRYFNRKYPVFRTARGSGVNFMSVLSVHDAGHKGGNQNAPTENNSQCFVRTSPLHPQKIFRRKEHLILSINLHIKKKMP